MKTLHTTTTQNTNLSDARMRSLAIITGMVIAILCMVTLLQDVRSTEGMDAQVPRLLQSSKILAADLFIEVKTSLR
jgi:low affinity Fe/Cu permease